MWPVSVEIVANPYGTTLPIEYQLMPPEKPPLPTAMKRSFHSLGRNSPNVYDDVAEEVTLIMTAHKGGRPVALFGYAISAAWPNVPLASTWYVRRVEALEGRT